MILTPGQDLFEYHIERELGRGAFGIVYLAQDTLLDRPVAIKELNTTRTDETDFKRFLQEARAAGGLNHPNIVTVYTLRFTEEVVYLVMEYLPGGSLRKLLDERGRLSVEDAVRIGSDVCAGMAAAHAKGIVHRDIKPENILLTADRRVKVGDFGIAHVPRSAGGMYPARLTVEGFQPGTMLYMSPEQITGHPVDGRSDVYQVGALLYEMLTGHHYVNTEVLVQRAKEKTGSNAMRFQARLYEMLEEAISVRDVVDVYSVRPEVPRWVGNIVAVTLAKQVTGRPTVEELARALQGKSVPQDRPRSDLETGNVRLAKEHSARGVRYADQSRWEEAIREFQAALRLDPDNAEAHRGLGWAYGLQSRWEEAIREFQAASRLDPDDAVAHRGLGWAYGLQSRWEEAIREFQTALRIDPYHIEAHNGLGWVYGGQGRLDEAIHEFQAAIRIDPDDAEAYNGLGCVYERQSRWEEAIRALQVALHIQPNLAMPHYVLAQVYDKQRLSAEAIHEAKDCPETRL